MGDSGAQNGSAERTTSDEAQGADTTTDATPAKQEASNDESKGEERKDESDNNPASAAESAPAAQAQEVEKQELDQNVLPQGESQLAHMLNESQRTEVLQQS